MDAATVSENKPVGTGDLSRVLTPEQIEFLSARTGYTREQLLAGLAATSRHRR